MIRAGHRPDRYTFPFALLAAAHAHRPRCGRAAHVAAVKAAPRAAANDHARCGRPGDACRVFDEIPRRDLVSWNAMISGYAKASCAAEAVALFAAMAGEGWEPNGVTLVGVLAACGDLGASSLGRRLEEEYAGRGARGSDPFVGSALIDMYGKCGDLAAARRVFDEIPAKDTAAWNAMITGQASYPILSYLSLHGLRF
ncbi:Pentatricopeptide repeat-containing protein [Ananas comosus]|uniref:Pentatricopeptide repeat-containing protein n=1 Tax=Ananas comosus TaxID=4615 RepID=A0A199VQ08_ANACO|nr:Pentatricopeptide repeat-containing protein [Ananas comosus]